MNLNDKEYYEITQAFLESQDLLEDITFEQYDDHPYSVLSDSGLYNQNKFRPTTVRQIENVLENGRMDVKSIDLLDKSERTSVLKYIGEMFEKIERFSDNSDTWFFKTEPDFDQLKKISKVSFTASQISRHFSTRKYSEDQYYSEEYSDIERLIHAVVKEDIENFAEINDIDFQD